MTQRYILGGPERGQILANAVQFLQRLPETRTWSVEVKQYQKPRSLKQNASLWAVAYPPLMEFMGERGERAKERLHEHFCGEFFGWYTDKLGGRRPVRTTTTDESGADDVIGTKAMSAFYGSVQQAGAELGCDIPDPDPMYGIRGRWAA